MVYDDDGDGFPSPEPRTDSRSALPREFRAWRRLRIVKHDEPLSIFSPRTRIYGVGVEVGGAPGGPRGRGRAPILVSRVWAPGLDSLPVFFIISKNNLRGVSGNSENFCFCT